MLVFRRVGTNFFRLYGTISNSCSFRKKKKKNPKMKKKEKRNIHKQEARVRLSYSVLKFLSLKKQLERTRLLQFSKSFSRIAFPFKFGTNIL